MFGIPQQLYVMECYNMNKISVNVEYVSCDGHRPLSKAIKGLSKGTGLRELSELLKNELEIDQNIPLGVKLHLRILFPPKKGNCLRI